MVAIASAIQISGHRFVGRIVAAARAHLDKMRTRHECRKLLDCSDHVPRDIGVNRAYVEAEVVNSLS